MLSSILNKTSAKGLERNRGLDTMLLLSFFLSGVSALIYQTSWQRLLYGVIGVDMDSITIIVSVFMFGIGFGGMLGGWISDRYPGKRLRLYAFTEMSIALYGACSLGLLRGVEKILALNAWDSPGISALACFAFLILPTTLMGVTLPLLTMAFNEQRVNIGVSVGQLYFFNTLGAAVGAALVPFLLLPFWTVDEVVWFAVFGNIVVAVFAVLARRKQPLPAGGNK